MSNRFQMIEGLESRKLFAASAAVVGDVLLVRGENGVRNDITVVNNVDGLNVDVTVVSAPGSGSPTTLTQSFAKSSFALLKIRGGLFGDNISVGQTGPAYTGNTRINGVSGNDTILGGAGTDRIAGGRGNDSISGNGGDDKIYGELGNDTLNGGDGSDVIWGGRGNDTINGGIGDDLIGCILGTNSAIGGDGADTFYLKSTATAQATDYVSGTDFYKFSNTGKGDVNDPPPTA